MRGREQLGTHVVEDGRECAELVGAGLGQRLAEIGVPKALSLRLELADASCMAAIKQPDNGTAKQQDSERATTDPEVTDAAAFVFLGAQFFAETGEIGVQGVEFERSGDAPDFQFVPDDRR